MSSNVDLNNYDSHQAFLMEERVILLDENDKVIGSESKKNSKANKQKYIPLCCIQTLTSLKAI